MLRDTRLILIAAFFALVPFALILHLRDGVMETTLGLASIAPEESPQDTAYGRLVEALAAYRRIQNNGGWRRLPAGRALKKGQRGRRILALRKRLLTSSDLDGSRDEEETLFTLKLEEAVRRFQRRHGLKEDGVVGPQTLEALNVSVDERIEQIRANMQRWRAFRGDLGRRYIGVNLADYSLSVMEEGRSALEMRVIIGKDYTRTPAFSDRMTYLVFQPYWNIPRNIALTEIVPLVKKDPHYLRNNSLIVMMTEGGKDKEIAPDKIDWAHLSDRHFPYYLRQSPGPENPLGRVKFMLPNRFNVYLHDSPSTAGFERSIRQFSHGCIRVEKALDLAAYLLKDQGWTRDKVSAAMTDGPKNHVVRLTDPIMVHILYRTAWVEEDGTVQFRKDIYHRDHEKLIHRTPK